MPLEDQQLAGVLMWVPGSVVYVAAALWLLVCWMRESERRVVAREAREAALEEALGETTTTGAPGDLRRGESPTTSSLLLAGGDA
jgi:hypothetical protein